MEPPALSRAAKRIAARMNPKTTLVHSPATMASR